MENQPSFTALYMDLTVLKYPLVLWTTATLQTRTEQLALICHCSPLVGLQDSVVLGRGPGSLAAFVLQQLTAVLADQPSLPLSHFYKELVVI